MKPDLTYYNSPLPLKNLLYFPKKDPGTLSNPNPNPKTKKKITQKIYFIFPEKSLLFWDGC